MNPNHLLAAAALAPYRLSQRNQKVVPDGGRLAIRLRPDAIADI
jgi:hypothetical protein